MFTSFIGRIGHGRSRVTRRPARLMLRRLEDKVAPAAGALDANFDVDGKLTFDIPGATASAAHGIATDLSDRVIVAGYATINGNDEFAVARFKTDGALDTGFNGVGYLTLPVQSGNGQLEAAAIDQLGNIYLAGWSSAGGADSNFAVVRLTNAGKLDNSFGTGGVAAINVSGGVGFDRAYAIAIDFKGRAVIAGQVSTTNSDFAVVRLTTTGVPDSTFDGDGIKTIDFAGGGSNDDFARGVAVDSMGRIVVAGSSHGATDFDFGIIRLLDSGSLDETFDADGRQIGFTKLSTEELGESVAVDALNRITVAGSAFVIADSNGLVMRFNADGSRDQTFATTNSTIEGDSVLLIADAADQVATSLVVDQSNRLIVGGFGVVAGNTNFIMRRYTTAGFADTTFGSAGFVTVDFGGNDQCFAAAIDRQGRAIGVGLSAKSIALTRLTADASAISLVSRADPAILNDAVGGTITESQSMSADGRFVVFTSAATNLIPGQIDTNHANDVFLFDTVTGAVQLVSHTATSFITAGNLDSYGPVISADGRIVVFLSQATNLSVGQFDSNNKVDVFLFDRVLDNTTLVSRTSGSATTTGNNASYEPALSANGAVVAFSSKATNLVAGAIDANATTDVFVFDRTANTTTLVSRVTGTSSTAANNFSSTPTISHDGLVIAFTSFSTNLVTAQFDTNSDRDVFAFDRSKSTMTLVSRVGGSPVAAGNGGSYDPAVGEDGAFISFTSLATNLAPGQSDTNNSTDVFLYERSVGSVILVSHNFGLSQTAADNSSSESNMSADGAVIAFQSRAMDLIAGQNDTNFGDDVFAFERSSATNLLASRISGSSDTTANAASYLRSISHDGAVIVFRSSATNVVAGQIDPVVSADVFAFKLASVDASLISHTSSSKVTAANGFSDYGGMGSDGLVVAFISTATNVTASASDVSTLTDVFVSVSGNSILASHRAPGLRNATLFGNSKVGDRQILSDNGRYLVFTSDSPNVIPGQIDTNNADDVFLHNQITGLTRLVSHVPGSLMTTANNGSSMAVISNDGNWIAFHSLATNLVTGQVDASTRNDVFLFEVASDKLILLSGRQGSSTKAASGPSSNPIINYDGSVIVFVSSATDLIAGHKSGFSNNVIAFDRILNSLTLVSHTATSTVIGAGSDVLSRPTMSRDGSIIAFASAAANIVAGQTDTNVGPDIFVVDRKSGTITLASHSATSPTTTGNGTSNFPVISGDSQIVTYVSASTNLVTGQTDTKSTNDVFGFERATGMNLLVSRKSGTTTTTGNFESYAPAINHDGTVIAYTSLATNLVPGQININNAANVIAFDRLSGAATLVSHANGSTVIPGSNSSALPSVSASGDVITYLSFATNLVSGQQDNLNSLDVFAFDRITGKNVLASRVSGSTNVAGNGYSYNANVSGDGTVISFASTSTNLVAGDYNRMCDVFVYAKPTGVQTLTINDASIQRSRVNSLKVSFDSLCLLPSTASAAFRLIRQSDGALVNLNAVVDYSGPTTVVTLTFTNGPLDFGSLADGRYTLTAFASQINGGNFDGDGNGSPGDDYVLVGTPVNGLFRLFGDANGDGTVNNVDFSALRLAFGGSSFAFDFNGTGSVDTADLSAFRLRFGSSV